MRLSNTQAIILWTIASDSCRVEGMRMGGLGREERLELVNEILQQQDNGIVELSDLPGIPEEENGKEQTTENSPEAHGGT